MMKPKIHPTWHLRLLVVFLAAALGCRAITGPYRGDVAVPKAPIERGQAAATLAVPSITDEPIPPPTLTDITSTPLPTSTTAVVLGDSAGFEVRVHPDGGLYVGDLVSFEVLAPDGFDRAEAEVEAAMPGEAPFAQAPVNTFGIARRTQATLLWAWDTAGLSPGEYELVFTVSPGSAEWHQTFTLLPAESLPPGVADIAWTQARNDCCTVNYMTGTAAGRDMAELLVEIDRQAQEVEAELKVDYDENVTITLLPRLLGHGGFAAGDIHISYLDRNYAGGLPAMVLHHELVHIMDSALSSDYRPALLAEGLAVYLSGGHFKPEPLMARAAALLDEFGSSGQPGLGWYLPMKPLADDFYRAQHEIGYLQAGALVEFMVQTWGWPAFVDFYGAIEEAASPSRAMDTALRQHYALSLSAMEDRFLEALQTQPYDPQLLEDVRLTVEYYDAVRRYQKALDPSAHFMTAWLLDTQRMRKEGIVADYARRPNGLLNDVLELILTNTGEDLVAGRSGQVEGSIAVVNAVLDAYDQGLADPINASGQAAEIAGLVRLLEERPSLAGFSPGSELEIQRLWIEGDQARAWVTAGDPRLLELLARRETGGAWQFLEAGYR